MVSPSAVETRTRKQSVKTAQLNGRRRSAFPPGPECFTPPKAEYICADHTVISLFACNRAADHTFREARFTISLSDWPTIQD